MTSAECVATNESGGYLGQVELKFQGREISSATSVSIDNLTDDAAMQNGGMSLRELLNRELANKDVAAKVATARRRVGQTQKINSLAKLRLSAGLSQQQVADGMGIQQPAIARWERNPGSITAENMRALAKALGSTMSNVAQAIEEQLMNQASMEHDHA